MEPADNSLMKTMAMIDSSGKFIYFLKVPNDEVDTELYILNVATENADNYLHAVQLGKAWN